MDEREPQPPEEVEGAPESAPAPPTTEPLPLEEQLKKIEEEREALFAQLVRRQADFENFRKRVEREQQELRQYAEADLVAALLPVLDGFERALAALPSEDDSDYRKGIELIYKQLNDVLSRTGLQPIEAVGRTFDPYLHHAVERIESAAHRDQEIIAELQRGYYFKQRVLRPALVRVAVHPRPSPEPVE